MKRLSHLSLLVFIAFAACTSVRQHVEHIHKLGEVLERDPSNREALSELKNYLLSSNGTLRTQAASVLGHLGTNHSDLLGDELVPLLIPRLNDEDGFVRRYAVLALGHYGKKAESAVPGLIQVLKDYKGWDAGSFAADLLGDLGTAAALAVPELIRTLDYRAPHPDFEFMMAERAGIALFKLSPLNAEQVAELQKRLASLSGNSLSYTALAILKSQPKDASASEALASVLRAGKLNHAGAALREIQNLPTSLFDLDVLLPALTKCSQSPNQYLRELGSQQLNRFGKAESKKGS